MTEILTLDLTGWRPALTPAIQERAVRAIEGGGVVVLPRVSFALEESERRFLSPAWSDGRAKNVSLDGDRLKGAHGEASDLREMAAMVQRFADGAASLVTTLFPRYAPYVQRARTSFRTSVTGTGWSSGSCTVPRDVLNFFGSTPAASSSRAEKG